jgi:hypothetical protein
MKKVEKYYYNPNYMKEKIYLICYKNDYFRKGEIANIVGMKKVTKYTNSIVNIANSSEICYHILFEDGSHDYVSINDVNNSDNDWHFVTLAELLMRGQPK